MPTVQELIDRITAQEHPGVAGPFTRLMGAKGTTSPGGYIRVNESLVADPQDRLDTLVHEQAHAQQSHDRGPLRNWLRMFENRLPYNQRSDELAAYQAENAGRAQQGLEANPIPAFIDTRSWLDTLRGAPAPYQGISGDIPLRRNALLASLKR